MTLPLVALVSNSTHAGRKLPRWVVVLLVLAGLAVGFLGFQGFIGGHRHLGLSVPH
jgi:type VI protein secretion system component VasF